VIVVEPFAPAHLDGFRALFEAASSPCFCRYWHFTGTKNEWLDRCAHRPDESFDEQADAVRRSDPSARGLVALRDGELVGWMKLVPIEAVPKLRSLPVYRAVEPAKEPSARREGSTYSIGCFMVHPAARRRGVARALLSAAESHVRAWGGSVIEGHPRRSTEPLHDEEAFQGPEELFRDLGYSAVHDVAPYPVYRKVLEPRMT
jgi:GNAT superfamily N-acetyltransferase